MPRQPKTKKNITTTPLDSYVAIVEATNDIDESPTDVQCEDITPSDESIEEVKPIKPKRAPKKKASAQHRLFINMIENRVPATAIKDKEPVTPIKDKEPIISEDEKTPEKNVRVIELSQCEKCGRKLSARTLQYSHVRVCPANEDNQPSIRCKKEDTEPPTSEPPMQEVAEPQIAKLRKRHDKLNSLFANAI